MTTNSKALQHNTWRLFKLVEAMTTNRLEQELAQAGLPPLCWYEVLDTLHSSPTHRLRLHELADALACRRSNLTRLIDRMEAADLVCRKSCPVDKRGSYAQLTPAGEAMRQRMQPIYEQAIALYFGQHLSDKEVSILTSVLQRQLAVVHSFSRPEQVIEMLVSNTNNGKLPH